MALPSSVCFRAMSFLRSNEKIHRRDTHPVPQMYPSAAENGPAPRPPRHRARRLLSLYRYDPHQKGVLQCKKMSVMPTYAGRPVKVHAFQAKNFFCPGQNKRRRAQTAQQRRPQTAENPRVFFKKAQKRRAGAPAVFPVPLQPRKGRRPVLTPALLLFKNSVPPLKRVAFEQIAQHIARAALQLGEREAIRLLKRLHGAGVQLFGAWF